MEAADLIGFTPNSYTHLDDMDHVLKHLSNGWKYPQSPGITAQLLVKIRANIITHEPNNIDSKVYNNVDYQLLLHPTSPLPDYKGKYLLVLVVLSWERVHRPSFLICEQWRSGAGKLKPQMAIAATTEITRQVKFKTYILM